MRTDLSREPVRKFEGGETAILNHVAHNDHALRLVHVTYTLGSNDRLVVSWLHLKVSAGIVYKRAVRSSSICVRMANIREVKGAFSDFECNDVAVWDSAVALAVQLGLDATELAEKYELFAMNKYVRVHPLVYSSSS